MYIWTFLSEWCFIKQLVPACFGCSTGALTAVTSHQFTSRHRIGRCVWMCQFLYVMSVSWLLIIPHSSFSFILFHQFQQGDWLLVHVFPLTVRSALSASAIVITVIIYRACNPLFNMRKCKIVALRTNALMFGLNTIVTCALTIIHNRPLYSCSAPKLCIRINIQQSIQEKGRCLTGSNRLPEQQHPTLSRDEGQ